MASKRQRSRNFSPGPVKRHRSRNFSVEEKELLIERLLRKRDIIESKKTDNLTVKAKEQAWQQITNEYNALSSSPRSSAELKTCWENMKRRSRKLSTEESKHIFETSGQYFDYQSERILYKVRDILTCSLDWLQNLGDLDTSQVKDMDSESLEMDKEKLSDSEDQDDDMEESSPTRLPLTIKKDMEERKFVHKATKTVPYVHTLSSSETTEKDGRHREESKTVSLTVHRKENFLSRDTNNNRNNVKESFHRQSEQLKNISDALAESKLELTKLAKEHAIAEEKRKVELHKLQLQEAKLKIEILKLELARKQSEEINNY